MKFIKYIKDNQIGPFTISALDNNVGTELVIITEQTFENHLNYEQKIEVREMLKENNKVWVKLENSILKEELQGLADSLFEKAMDSFWDTVSYNESYSNLNESDREIVDKYIRKYLKQYH